MFLLARHSRFCTHWLVHESVNVFLQLLDPILLSYLADLPVQFEVLLNDHIIKVGHIEAETHLKKKGEANRTCRTRTELTCGSRCFCSLHPMIAFPLRLCNHSWVQVWGGGEIPETSGADVSHHPSELQVWADRHGASSGPKQFWDFFRIKQQKTDKRGRNFFFYSGFHQTHSCRFFNLIENIQTFV